MWQYNVERQLVLWNVDIREKETACYPVNSEEIFIVFFFFLRVEAEVSVQMIDGELKWGHGVKFLYYESLSI